MDTSEINLMMLAENNGTLQEQVRQLNEELENADRRIALLRSKTWILFTLTLFSSCIFSYGYGSINGYQKSDFDVKFLQEKLCKTRHSQVADYQNCLDTPANQL